MKLGQALMGALAVAVAAGVLGGAKGDDPRSDGRKRILQQDIDLSAARTAGTRYFEMVTTLTNVGLDGTRGETEAFRMKLLCVSQGDASKAADEYTCRRFVYVRPDGSRVSIPALEGWRHSFRKTATGCDEKGYVFGIDHAKFERLSDADGSVLQPSKAYLMYNTFIDFHGFCDEFATPVAEGKGIQDLTRIGQRIVHAAANTKPPTSLGSNIKAGSLFKNGEITLLLKGLSLVDDAACAVVEFDSGASTFRMLMEPMPDMEVRTDGGSHYFGDIYIDLESRWPRRVELRELVVSETNVPLPGGAAPMKVNSVIERQVTIKVVTKEAYESES